MKSIESSFKSNQSIDSQEENKEEVGEMEECNQSQAYHNKISQKEIWSIILTKFKAGVPEKELLKKNRELSPSTEYRYQSNLKSEKGSGRWPIIKNDASGVILQYLKKENPLTLEELT